MLNLRTSLLLVSLALAAPGSSVAGDRAVELPFRQGMRMLIENNLRLESARLGPDAANAAARSAAGAFDPALFGSFSRSDATTPLSARSSVAAGGLGSVESESYSLSAGISGRTGIGTEYRFEVRDDWTADSFSGFDYEYESFTGVTVRQPLLKGVRSDEARSLELSLVDREISGHRFRQALTEELYGYAGAWWDLATARRSLEARREARRLAETLRDVGRKKLEAGVISRLELVQAESAVAARKEDELAAAKAVRDADRRLRELIADDAAASGNAELAPVGEGPLGPPAGGLDEAASVALSTRPDYLELKKALEKERISVRYAADRTWPSVDLEASWGLQGLGDSLSRSFSSIDSNPRWSVGLAFSYPIGNRQARGGLEAAGLEARQALLKLKQTEREIVLRLSAAFAAIEADMQRVEAADEAVRLAEATLAAEEKRLEAGRSTTFNVLRIQEDLLLARLKRLRAAADYNMALAGFYREKGTLIEELGIRITDIKEAR